MEILQFLLSFFLKEYGGGTDLSPIFNALKENSFDVKKTLQNLNLETLVPLIKKFMEGMSAKSSSNNFVVQESGITPIAKIADKEIVYALNKYFA